MSRHTSRLLIRAGSSGSHRPLRIPAHVTDGQQPGGGDVDQFRIKIWDVADGTVVYDNQLGDTDDGAATDAIEGGSIVIHAPRKR